MDELSITQRGIKFDPKKPPLTLLLELAIIAQELRGLEKSGTNSHFNYDFFEEAALANALVPKLVSHGIGYVAGSADITNFRKVGETRNGADKFLTDVTAEIMFTHPKSGEWVIVPGVGSGEDNSDKGTPKAITAAIKYIWMKTFMIAEGNDAERSEYDQRREEGGAKKAAPKDKKAPTNPACADCHKSIAPIKKADEPEIPTSEVVRRTTEKFGRALCMGCAKKASGAPAAAPAAVPAAAPKAGGKPKAANPPTVEHVPDSDWKEIDGQITGVSTRKVVSSKGTKVVTEIEFNGFDGKITSWHTETVNPALQKAKGKQAVVVFSSKVNGRYTNHTLEKLLFLDGAVWSDNKPPRTELDKDVDEFVAGY